MGRVKRRAAEAALQRAAAAASPSDDAFDGAPSAALSGAPALCPLCERPIPPEARSSLHHLTPKLRGGKHGPTVRLHQICHNEIHATLSETEIARGYTDIASLRAHPRLAKFIAWVKDKPPAYHGRSLKSVRRRRR